MQEGKVSPPERSIICLFRSTTFLSLPKSPLAHRLEMVTFPRRFVSPQEETSCRGKVVSALIFQDSYCPIFINSCWIGSYFWHASFSHFSGVWSSIFNFFLRGNPIHIKVPLLLIAMFCCSTHTMLYSLSKTGIKAGSRHIMAYNGSRGCPFNGRYHQTFFFYFSIILFSFKYCKCFKLLSHKMDISGLFFCSLVDIQWIFELCLFPDVVSVSQRNYFWEQWKTMAFFLSVISSTNTEVYCFCLTFKRGDWFSFRNIRLNLALTMLLEAYISVCNINHHSSWCTV